ncbi:MAG TPA: IPT/TIG domain-containing protein [Saprospiraceae bacterium]|nr:IPT/TIG domain-containing protein [Saprospiraceae bacterium]
MRIKFIKFLFPIWFLLVLVQFSSCEEEDSFVSLITEEIIFTNSDIVRVLARVIGAGDVMIEDHGFQISENEQFGTFLRVSLGSRERVGRFIGEITGLDSEKLYYIRAFSISEGREIFGNTLSFTTLIPEIQNFTPKVGLTGSLVVLKGKNFTTDIKVFFGDREAVITDRRFDAELTVRVPSPGNQNIEKVSIHFQGNRIEFEEPFEYITGSYEKISDFPDNQQFSENIYFQSNGKFYAGLGLYQNNQLNDKMWEFSLADNQWTEVNFPGGFHGGGFFAGEYFGSGVSQFIGSASQLGRDFWRIQNGSFQKLPDLPFETYRSPAFVIRNELYVVGQSLFTPRIVNKYNPSTGLWTRLPDADFTVLSIQPRFTHNDKQYFVNHEGAVLEFDPGTNAWTKIDDYPGDSSRSFGFGVVIGNKAYIGLYLRSSEIWELDLETMKWTPKVNFPGSTFAHNAGIFVEDGIIYILRSGETNTPALTRMELWKFDPNGL